LTQYSYRSDASRPSFASQVDAAIANAADLTPSQDPEDPDDWLTVNAEDLDRTLQESMNHHAPRKNLDMDSEDEERDATHAQVAKLKDLANKVDEFVAGKGDIEGAMFDE
jgi:hypothetical protein